MILLKWCSIVNDKCSTNALMFLKIEHWAFNT
jgi:hypothetical protein